jgi:hypothetical protein
LVELRDISIGDFFKTSLLFSPYILGSGFPEYLILSQAGRKLMGHDAATEVPTVYLEHDEIVIRFYLHLQQMRVTEQDWSESELKRDRALAINNLGDGTVGKIPDLLFDVRTEKEGLRCALEIERTRKSGMRYQSMRRAYERAAHVDLIIFGVADKKIEYAIRKEVSDGGLEFYGKEIGFFALADFAENKFQAVVRIAGKELSLESFFLSLGRASSNGADFARHGVRVEPEDQKEAA